MADVASTLAVPAYREALERIWNNIVDTRMHITGGLGAVQDDANAAATQQARVSIAPSARVTSIPFLLPPDVRSARATDRRHRRAAMNVIGPLWGNLPQ